MTSAVHEQREALGLRLRELRRDAGLTARRLAELAHWHESKVSRIEYGKQQPSEADLRAWCAHTGSDDQLADLIATLRNIQAAYLEWKRLLGTGTRRRQRLSIKLEGETGSMRWYEPALVPGLLQTPEYAEGVLRKIISFYRVPDDLDEGVATRIERQHVLYRGDHRFSFVIAEQVLRTTVVDDSVMLGQLDRLMTVMTLPRVQLGIVPERAVFEGPAMNGFIMFDNRLVHVETVSAELSITQPREIALYSRMFTQPAEQAVYGEAARGLIRAELEGRRRR
ncbi:helix-turn-helix domain-containing protein [Nocardia seriolae]|uniref:XRE family transcriptional regulator n=1 Tax=Nocardia seriolae TaxID=37332 RepID=A0ABC9Z6J9_9NOCA|nr:helix-turn-helix transcriptional regulator [Nocardia seriolae]PSK26764.1 XRE family transcriptional regulator [Nocardia seriolae]QOW32737.1 helix-turn-helix domain-containing protein [Nocardia seriolae]QUN20347.1 helix-turn-helix domain-containing protein [Nocardia seriolae]WNJ59858.1 helix-turn-helix transcriptional regulator [Nocardia seriolae]BEK92734.1 helix-turn-helix transcriptional regulator [Nocardia seriolae]